MFERIVIGCAVVVVVVVGLCAWLAAGTQHHWFKGIAGENSLSPKHIDLIMLERLKTVEAKLKIKVPAELDLKATESINQ